MEQELTPLVKYKYDIEVGHAKQGSEHVLILKSLKVRDDDLGTAVAEIKAALTAIQEAF